MKKMYITVGISASGKSSWAKETAELENCVVIERDQIRFNKVLPGSNWSTYKFTKKREELVSEIADNMFNDAVENGQNVIISDTNDNEVKTFDIQTNEFGSFTGEYDIPKNVLTGEFSISIEEPEDVEMDTKYYDKKEEEHSFWDKVDYDKYPEFRFKVEEYKRPTFEITFDEITENYTIGDKITIKGMIL